MSRQNKIYIFFFCTPFLNKYVRQPKSELSLFEIYLSVCITKTTSANWSVLSNMHASSAVNNQFQLPLCIYSASWMKIKNASSCCDTCV